MHKHEHGCTSCKHECLHYCNCCSQVYCCKCNQEWGGNLWYQSWTSPALYGTACDRGDTTTACTHSQ